MTTARFSIGIDLGTTNTALAFVELDGDATSQILAIPQLESAVAIVEAATLPSFLYLPEDAATPDAGQRAADERWVIGRFARAQAALAPARVVHSAKSWLAHHSADRSAPILPWGSDALGADDKLSPVRAAALILRYVRDAWNDRFAAGGDDFDGQLVTITVPASFDAVAQRLTLDAAHAAGYPGTVRLLEEPQAALYRWLEGHDPAARHVLVVDIGGGTSDFSLFEFGAGTGSQLHIKRIAVSEHILLGGDNMDLALAHRLEPELADDGELSGRQWEYLVARSRDLKETALQSEGLPDDAWTVSISGRGSRLIAQARSAHLARAQIERLVLDGFFPEVAADEYPIRARAALRELGLPYARDPAVTRHLADFLRERPAVDAVLFNGGSLYPQRLRERIRAQIGAWQHGAVPDVLENSQPDLAVARGAARFGKLVAARANRIEAGAAHAIFLQAHRGTNGEATDDAHPLVCVLPQGALTESTFTIRDLALELRINAPVRFQTFSSARHAAQRAGDIVAWNERDFTALPALETVASTAQVTSVAAVPVRLTSRVSELGRLEIACVSADPQLRATWPLEFNLRRAAPNGGTGRTPDATAASAAEIGPGVPAGALDAARTRIVTLFDRPLNPRDKLTATRLIKSLETIVRVPKNEWNVVFVRSLWATLEGCLADRARSVDHEEAWLILAGFLLRPGFGAALDDLRIDRLWRLRETGLFFSAKTVKIQEYILWRRVAGGLSSERQQRVLWPELDTLRRPGAAPPELVLLAGSLERIGLELKTEFSERWIEAAANLERERKHNAHLLTALSALLGRAPLYAGPENVVPPEFVERAFDAFADFAWDGPRRTELATLFLRAARVVDDRKIGVSRALRGRIADRLERAGVSPARTAPLRGYVALQGVERAGNFGESLPPGLILRAQSAAS